MNISATAIVSGVFPSKKNTNVYVSLVDTSNGGQFKLTFPGGVPDVRPGDMVKLDCAVNPSVSSQWGLSLQYVSGSISKKQ